jgi:hypothetical protein
VTVVEGVPRKLFSNEFVPVVEPLDALVFDVVVAGVFCNAFSN